MKGQVSVEGAFRPTSHQAGGGSAVPEGQGSSLGVSMTPGEAHLICRSPGELLRGFWEPQGGEVRDARLTFFSQVQSHFGDSNASYVALGIARTNCILSCVVVLLAGM